MDTILTSPIQDPQSLAWAFPAGWTAEQKSAWTSVCGEVVHHEKRTANAVDVLKTKLADPETMLARKRGDVAEAKRIADAAERHAKGELAWIQARASFGAAVCRIDSEEGDVIIHRRMNEAAIDAANARSSDLEQAELAKLTSKSTKAEIEAAEHAGLVAALDAQRDALIENTTVGGLEAAESAARLRYLMREYAMLFQKLGKMRNAMVVGFREAEGKDSAP